MKQFLNALADIFDGLAILAAAGAAFFFLTSFVTVETGPEFMQIGMLALLIAVIPHCLASALNRICSRIP